MTSLYEISYYGIEQHITLTLPAWRCLFTVRNYMTLFNTFALMRAVGVVVWLSLGMAKVPGSRRRQYSVVSIIFFIATATISLFCTFCSLFHTMANISIFLSHWHSHINFYFQLANLCVVAKIEMHVKMVIFLYRVTNRDNSKQNR